MGSPVGPVVTEIVNHASVIKLQTLGNTNFSITPPGTETKTWYSSIYAQLTRSGNLSEITLNITLPPTFCCESVPHQ